MNGACTTRTSRRAEVWIPMFHASVKRWTGLHSLPQGARSMVHLMNNIQISSGSSKVEKRTVGYDFTVLCILQ